ncbi:hypothetical protein A6A19_00265 [Actinobacillus delphinicola]|uniref:Fic family protein n=1 Tax=Actinobacillus delphinicola TaxID=51161 RepID=UPI0024418DC5|nr:Fic family protein [Actinobacillus delphinicola]MDG6896479.1 hypothetical protein [Actinobacillus delphinicola]
MSLKKFKQDTKEHIARTLLNFENINLSELQTRQLLQTKALNMAMDDVDTVIVTNLLNTFDYVENLNLKSIHINLDLYKKLNEYLTHEQALFPGNIRTQDAYIACIDGSIPPCNVKEIDNKLSFLDNLSDKNYKDVVADTFMDLIRSQPFYDGNKRSTLFLCNLALAKNNLGYFSIPNSRYDNFEYNLTLFYRDNNKEPLKEMIKNELIMPSIQQKFKESLAEANKNKNSENLSKTESLKI